ncbi:Lrp/AsnC family transcriptional regulator [Thermococcus gammatolerans]|uniref:Transcription regulator, Lrp-AsnC family n=1 Tax=Thermococcus gammatolerans (strain DSM 15229 / JCM 11827 / EJ3) TaxID=593117 RepID=C5A5V0_THEGJ|nr:Lrp/AsnC family transcriptional regulator [Thermococcus gammatolerans]ACS33612.1 Transcription regulator, Lrp-AsnC family [Thermococcus gammatolerans EJ3]
MIQLDDLDRAILRLLKKDARLTISEIAEALNRPESTVHFRIKKLIERGVIDHYTILLGPELRPKRTALVILQVETPIIEDFLERYVNHIMKTLSMLPNVLLVAKSGRDTVIALLGDENEEKLNAFIDENIRTLPTLKSVNVYPVDDVKKGEELVGFLVEV